MQLVTDTGAATKKGDTMTIRKSFCRICSAYCGIKVEIQDGKIIAISGDPEHPMSRGYTCTKGRQWASQYYAKDRLLYAQKRDSRKADFQRTDPGQALDEIAEKLQAIIKKHGPRAVAVYRGNGLSVSSNGNQIAHAWLKGLGSEMDFSSLTIDQPAKIVAAGRHGIWGGGAHGFEKADVCMLVGNNPIISALHMMGGPPGYYPTALREAKKRGLKLIVADPRRTEVAEHADIYLPIRPGEDPALLGAMIRLILEEQLHDAEFCDANTEGLEALQEAVQALTLEYAAKRTGLRAEDIAAAARMFAEGQRGTVSSGTGPDMARYPNLTEHLIISLNSLCGRWNREGEQVSAPSLLTPNVPPPAQTLPVEFLPEEFKPEANTAVSRIRGIRQLYAEMPTGVAADEILTPGEGKVRALVVIGGNPVMSWPDQENTLRALADLELLVCIDIKETATTRRADYKLPAAHAFERDNLAEFTDRLYEKPCAQYSGPLLLKQGDVQEEWRYLAGLAARMGTSIELPGGTLDVSNPKLDTLDVLELMFPPEQTKVPVREIAKREGAQLFEEFAGIRVSAPYPGIEAKLQFMPAGVQEDISCFLAEDDKSPGDFPHLLTVRRVKHVYNSSCHDFPSNPPGNPAYVHPQDLAQLGLADGDVASLESEHAAVKVIVRAEDALRRGVVSMSHCFGGDPDRKENLEQVGAPASRLLNACKDYDTLTGIPRMSALPVRLKAV